MSTYLTDIGIVRAAISIIMTLQDIAILLFLPFSTRIAGRFGKVSAIALVSFATIPFMIILANGYNYGGNTELIAGGALLVRAGFANISGPIVSSLTMELVDKNYRSVYASLIYVVTGLAQIPAGTFTKYYLFNTAHGYANAYFYAIALYIAANIMFISVFAQKYNKNPELEC
jgi:MFS family permease